MEPCETLLSGQNSEGFRVGTKQPALGDDCGGSRARISQGVISEHQGGSHRRVVSRKWAGLRGHSWSQRWSSSTDGPPVLQFGWSGPVVLSGTRLACCDGHTVPSLARLALVGLASCDGLVPSLARLAPVGLT